VRQQRIKEQAMLHMYALSDLLAGIQLKFQSYSPGNANVLRLLDWHIAP